MTSPDPATPRRPEVTVSDPARPTTRIDVLGDDPPPRSHHTRVLAGLVVVAVAGWAISAEVRDRRAEADRERARQAAIELEVTGPLQRTGFVDQTGGVLAAVTAVVTAEVRNTGPRPVTVVGAQLGDHRFAGLVPLEPGQAAPLRLTHRFSCDREPPLRPLTPTLRLTVQTAIRTADTVLGVRDAPDAAREDDQRSCGYRPLEQAVVIFSEGVPPADDELAGDELVADLLVLNTGRRAARLLAVRPQRGLLLRVQTADGERYRQPLLLPPQLSDGGVGPERLRLRLAVDCAAVLRGAGYAPDPEVPSGVLAFAAFDDDLQTVARVDVLLGDAETLLSRLVDRC